MGENHSVGGNWHGGNLANCSICAPVVKVVVPVVKVEPVETKTKKKVGA